MIRRLLIVPMWIGLFGALGCSDGDESPAVTSSEPMARAFYDMSARILGLVEHDDDADLRITLSEKEGVAARINFLRLTCTNGSVQEWGAGSLASELGSNRIAGFAELVLVRHYFCPSSSRPARLLADIDDENGFHHQVIAVPFHPDWPGT